MNDLQDQDYVEATQSCHRSLVSYCIAADIHFSTYHYKTCLIFQLIKSKSSVFHFKMILLQNLSLILFMMVVLF